MSELSTERTMTIREVSDSLKVSRSQIEKTVRLLFPDKMNKGFKTYLNEYEVTKIKQQLQSNPYFGQLSEVATDLEMHEMTLKVMNYHVSKYNELKIENDKLLNTVNILTHVNKTYTATEIAKELNLKSAQVLNAILEKKKIQYRSNGTWVLFSDYSDLGYTDIKQTTLDNGRVVYDRHFTQIGREFLLNIFKGDR